MSASELGDRQQAVVLEMLRGACGAPVSFARLQAAGVEFPASVVVELELAGVPVDRCRVEVDGGRRAAAVRLDPERDPASRSAGGDGAIRIESALAVASAEADAVPTHTRRSRALARRRRRWALIGVLLVAAAALGGVIVGLGGPAGAPHRAARSGAAIRPRPPVGSTVTHTPTTGTQPASRSGARTTARHPATSRRRRRRPARAGRARPPAAPPVSATRAWTLDIRGHDLLLAGRYAAAITTLRASMAATGETLGACRQPTTETCLVYGYALYDIGEALLSRGGPPAAASVFEERLQIDNQLPVVAAALALARARGG